MIIGDSGTLGQAIYGSAQVKSQLDRLTAQAGSGYVADSYAGLGAAAQTPLSLKPQIAGLAAQQTAIDSVTGQLGVSQTALTQINSIATSLHSQLAALNDVTPTQIDSVAQTARSGLQQVAALLNTTDGSTYVFGGHRQRQRAGARAPRPSCRRSSSSRSAGGVRPGRQRRGGDHGGDAGRRRVRRRRARRRSPGRRGRAPTLDLGAAAPVQVGCGGEREHAGGFGRHVDHRVVSSATSCAAWRRVANLSSSQANASGFSALVQDTGTSLSGAITALGTEQGALGDIQSSLAAQQDARPRDTSTALTAQVSSAEDVDMAKTLSDLSQTQTQLSASYKLIGEMSDLSLVKYL